MEQSELRAGDVIEVVTERLAYGGEAVARYGGLTVFVAMAAPGERLRVRVVERKKRFARAVIEEIVAPSPSRREPPCRYFGQCGGCQLQHLTYEAQLDAKAGFIRDALSRIGRIDWPRAIEIHSAQEFGYRARAQVKIESRSSTRSREDLLIGFNRAASHSVCDVESCPILLPALDKAYAELRSSLKGQMDSGSAPRNLPSEIEMAAGDHSLAMEPAPEGLRSGAVTLTVNGAAYTFSPSTFFQVNPHLLEGLVKAAAGESSGRLAIDLYAGVGLFTLQLARRFDRVIGIESNPRAVDFARANISANKASNVVFHKAGVEQWLKEYVAGSNDNDSARHAIDLMLLDPPRSGAAEAIDSIVELKPKLISYVSCDPTTLARDLRRLIDSGYRLDRVTAFDLFPQTYHVETVAALSL